MLETKDCVETLLCELSEKDVVLYSQAMADVNQLKIKLETEKKEITKDIGARLQKYVADINLLSLRVSTKKETRDVDCRWEFDFDAGEKTLYRLDTAEVVRTEAIADEERQGDLELEDKPSVEIDESITCVDCGAPEGEQHSEGCPTVAEEVAEECQLPEVTDESPEKGEEQGPDQAKEETEEMDGPAADDIPESEDCFGTFDPNDAECAKCDRLDDCSKETLDSKPEEVDAKDTEEPPEEPKDKPKFYTCKKCKKGFDEYVDNGDGIWECPHCKAADWM